MSRKSWIVNPNPPYNLIPKEEYVQPERAGYHIMPDMPDFVSPIDGRVVKGRKGYRDHCKAHNVTNASDFKETWAKGKPNWTRQDKQARLDALKHAYDTHRGR